jgi:hypothetical protein
MPSRHDVRDAGIERQSVQRRMRLDEAPVPLLGQLGVDGIVRLGAVIEPRREVPQRVRQVGILEDEQRADHLQPGRARLAAGADDDVAGTEAKAQPPATVLDRGLVVDQGGHAASVSEATAIPGLFASISEAENVILRHHMHWALLPWPRPS